MRSLQVHSTPTGVEHKGLLDRQWRNYGPAAAGDQDGSGFKNGEEKE